MGKLVVVQGDAVQGTDRHKVFGQVPAPKGPYTGTCSYPYKGAMTRNLSAFVTIAGQAVAMVASESTLNPGETAPGGGHDPQAGQQPTPPQPDPASLKFLPPVTGVGSPNAKAGSAFVTILGTKVVLHGDLMDTCDHTGVGNSTVKGGTQTFVTCSA